MKTQMGVDGLTPAQEIERIRVVRGVVRLVVHRTGVVSCNDSPSTPTGMTSASASTVTSTDAASKDASFQKAQGVTFKPAKAKKAKRPRR